MKNNKMDNKLLDDYVKILYFKMKNKNKNLVLSESKLEELSKVIIKRFYDNYLKIKKTISIHSYFYRRIINFERIFDQDEKLILCYVHYVGVNDEIKNYFYNKYLYLLKPYLMAYEDDYKKVIDDLLNKDVKYITILESKIKKELKKLKNDKFMEMKNNYDYEKIYNYYSYIKDLVFKKYNDRVVISPDELMHKISEKYKDYVKVVIKKLKNKDDFNINKYLNNRLSTYVEESKSFYEKVYVDEDEKEKNKKDYVYLVEKYAVKYAGSVDKKIMVDHLSKKYDELLEEYYRKNRKTTFLVFIQNGLRCEANMLHNNYVDDETQEKTKKPNLK